MLSEEDIQAEWQAAVDDLQVVEGADVVFWPVEGYAEHSYDEAAASAHPPGRAWLDERFIEPLKARGYDIGHEMRARVAFFVDFYDPGRDGVGLERELVAAILRHELEHVLQLTYWHSRGFNLFDFDGIVDDVLDVALRNKSTLYHAKPIEQDANAAASRYLITRFEDAQLQKVHKGQRFGELVRWYGPQPPQTLVARTLAFCLMFRESIAAWEDRTGRSFPKEIETHLPEATHLWAQLVEAASDRSLSDG